ncbi:hypothetical protein P8C59_006742 [Phyllachora maydis]|uniref:DUF7053 domain-containing protein n=1 Tax=Phyllachora maydis TaxID=1825666 RepID=A0AAD9I849_9PEZI|nr:hypothetical protein P8C59_006742 [Phyllachora maydis]
MTTTGRPPALQITTRVAIPARVDPALVLAALHAYEPLIVANPYLDRFERRAVPLGDLVGDAFFHDDGRDLQAFTVHDRVPLVAGLAKAVVVPCIFQAFDRGVRCRADAQWGVVVRSSYEVTPRGEVPPAANEAWAGEWELVETASIACGALLRCFVKRSFTSAHQLILQRVVNEIARESGE